MTGTGKRQDCCGNASPVRVFAGDQRLLEDTRTIVSTCWLNDHLNGPDIRVVDGSWYLPDAGRDVKAEYAACHIPGAMFFDIDRVADLDSPLPHMAPAPGQFAAQMEKLGIGGTHRVVAYDSAGVFSAARVWWLFRLAGHEAVAVLDGGLKKWIADGFTTAQSNPVNQQCSMPVRQQADLVRTMEQVDRYRKDGDVQIVDARPAARFAGVSPEPRAGLRSGHIPGSLNLPYTKLLNPDGTFKPRNQLKHELVAAGVSLDRPVVTTCGSGVTAAMVNLALEIMGHRDHALYDGSWAEWGAFGPEVAPGES